MKTSWNTATAIGAGLLSALLVMSAAYADDSPASHEPGVWQKHQYSFAYMGFTTTYSCDGLADKLRQLLIAAGARADVKSRAGACAAGLGRPDKFARAELTFYTLAPPSADKAAEGKPIDGLWRPVTFAVRSPRELGAGDCELIEQFKSNVLPMFTTRNIDGRTTCVPHQETGSPINLKFESFTAPPAKPAQAGRSHKSA